MRSETPNKPMADALLPFGAKRVEQKFLGPSDEKEAVTIKNQTKQPPSELQRIDILQSSSE